MWQQQPVQQSYEVPKLFETGLRRVQGGGTGLRRRAGAQPQQPPSVPRGPGTAGQPQGPGYAGQQQFAQPQGVSGGPRPRRQAPAPALDQWGQPVTQPQQIQPESAWGTQLRRIEAVNNEVRTVNWRAVIGWLMVPVLLVVLAASFLLYALTFGVLGTAFYGTVAFCSLVVIILVMFLVDMWHPMPVYMKIIAVLWGAGVSTMIAGILNSVFGEFAYAYFLDEQTAHAATAMFSAPVTEELLKGLGVALIFLVFRKHITGPLDGIIIGALVGGGFAFVENIQYYLRAAEAGGVQAATMLIVVRGVLGIWGHCVFTSMTGMVIGLIDRRFGLVPAILSFLVAPLPAMFLHFMWNFSSTLLGGFGGLVLLAIGWFVMFTIWFILIAVLIRLESGLTRARLGDYANQGWLTHDEVTMLATWSGRREGRRWAATFNAKPTMKKFIRQAAELAFTRQRLLADGAKPRHLEAEQYFLNHMEANRANLLSQARQAGVVPQGVGYGR
ncbi:PrsW family glutamic-type intramembrane protease [Helcobacillus massiliensis]|uniref:PrsW family glutamic-type intramembrane protease n=1 Tax=Helcobacillus massiliensis TaxID=521392 RepID=UPI002556D184|nr:PrsW family glutamic-type intramembrane protease [Helcobacillus massiliensis]MDK7742017.1 PrsW family glutamic-type intramembrane protease [Helcobacillus massiliensis]WOO93074.1 PrsW family glutamic-type intramembrane protease [Helcobacillus massiliensis]